MFRRLLFALFVILLLFQIIPLMNCGSNIGEQAIEEGIKRNDPKLVQAGRRYIYSEKKLNDEEEYMLGQKLAQMILGEFGVVRSSTTLKYINLIGNTLASASDRPNPYKGYMFFVLNDYKNKNAFAIPGGFIFITAGMIRLLHNEDELAGILAHEISHCVMRHPVDTMQKKNRLAAELAIKKKLDKSSYNDLQKKSDKEAVNEMIRGYETEMEFQADMMAVDILVKSGYNPTQLSAVLNRLRVIKDPTLTVHGDPIVRSKNVLDRSHEINEEKRIPPIPKRRDYRFKQVLKKLRGARR